MDLSQLLGGQPVAGSEADYVRMNGAYLEVDIDGSGSGSDFVAIAEFANAPLSNGLRIFVDDEPADVTVVI